METGKLLKLAKICQAFEAQGMPKESDMIFESLVRLANWQAPYMNEPMENRMVNYKTRLEPELNEADEERQDFERYNDQTDILVNADPADKNIEAQNHPEQSNPAGGIKNVWYDGPSSLEQGGKDWGRTMEERESNNAAGQKYKNLSPNFS
jgi:hypothetical protein